MMMRVSSITDLQRPEGHPSIRITRNAYQDVAIDYVLLPSSLLGGEEKNRDKLVSVVDVYFKTCLNLHLITSTVLLAPPGG